MVILNNWTDWDFIWESLELDFMDFEERLMHLKTIVDLIPCHFVYVYGFGKFIYGI